MTMDTITTEIADGIFRISTGVEMPPKGFTFNQFLVKADEPLIFHTGPRQMFPLVSEAVGKIVPLDGLRWITFGHVESDESGAMNLFLDAAPQAQVAHGALGCAVSLNDLADRPPRPLADGEVMDLGAKRVRHIDTPHVPHNWESRVLFEETTRALLCGDLFTSLGDDVPALSEDDPVGPALEAEEVFHASSLGPTTADTMRRLGDLEPKVLAVMHGPSYSGDGGASLRALADAYEKQYLTLA
jgi:flavorubredoxin